MRRHCKGKLAPLKGHGPAGALASRENGYEGLPHYLSFLDLTKKWRVMDMRATQSRNETSMRTHDSALSLIRKGPYELRVMKLCSQEATEELWLELIDH